MAIRINKNKLEDQNTLSSIHKRWLIEQIIPPTLKTKTEATATNKKSEKLSTISTILGIVVSIGTIALALVKFL